MKITLLKQALNNLGMMARRRIQVIIISVVFALVGFPLVFSFCSSFVLDTGQGQRNLIVKEALYLHSYARLKTSLSVPKEHPSPAGNEDMEQIVRDFIANVTSVKKYEKALIVLSLTEAAISNNKKGANSPAAAQEGLGVSSLETQVKSLSDSRITFVSNANKKYEIFVSNPDGTGRQKIFENEKNSNFPRLSYDLKKVVFISDMDGTPEVYSINSDGTGLLKLTENNGFNCYPGFSPDGTKIIFHSYQGESSEIYLMNADGSGLKRLTSNGTDEIEPCFSPDGKSIAFASDMDGDYEIYVMNLASMDIFQITNNSTCDWEPCFSPDGKSLAYSSNEEGKYNIYVAGVSGNSTRKISTSFTGADNTNPYFSPDGKKIAFSSNIDGDFEIYNININTLECTKVTDNDSDEWIYSWY